jgi:hypothetical protein
MLTKSRGVHLTDIKLIESGSGQGLCQDVSETQKRMDMVEAVVDQICKRQETAVYPFEHNELLAEFLKVEIRDEQDLWNLSLKREPRGMRR